MRLGSESLKSLLQFSCICAIMNLRYVKSFAREEFDYIVLLSSGMISVFALAKNIKNNKKLSIVALICQFFFCADVISLFVMHRISKKQAQIPLTIQEPETV